MHFASFEIKGIKWKVESLKSRTKGCEHIVIGQFLASTNNNNNNNRRKDC